MQTEAADTFARAGRAAILRTEKQTAVAVVAEFAKLARRLEFEIDRLTKEIALSNDAVNLIAEQTRLKQILDAVSRELKPTSEALARLTASSRRAAVAVARFQLSETLSVLQSKRFAFDLEATRVVASRAADDAPLFAYFNRLAVPLRRQMFQILTSGTATGKPSTVIASELKDAIKGTAADALTIVRTETINAYRTASVDFYRQASITKYRFLSALDLRTCPICWRYHGRIFKRATRPFLHINCRCAIVPVFDGDPAVETGVEKFARLNESQQKAILGAARYAKFAGGTPLAKMVATRNAPLGKIKILVNVSDL